MKTTISQFAAGMALCMMLACLPAFGQTKSILDAMVQDAVNQFNLIDSRHQGLEDRAAGMLVFPQVTKGGIGLASEYGEGALLVHGATVDYYSIASASVGLTAGMATHSEIILFMARDALDRFTKSKGWSIGADTGLVVMTKGRMDDYDSNKLKKPILAFTFAGRGIIADISLHGTRVRRIKK
ncbi:MAG TPA: lipid-binding SYLF domain-containing protein [Steroidobacteraceae bacterium]|nr:lipid-binding SYLF domain-containing protein [Steroidobacteraceae bacterium]